MGGKQLLSSKLIGQCPSDVRERVYFEPFLGAASLFFSLRPLRSVLGDANNYLMSAYEFIRRDPSGVSRHLRSLAESDSESAFYQIRLRYNDSRPSAAQAARFIYLNRTCFNGIFRVNRQGDFNVPYGFKTQPWFPSLSDLRHTAAALQSAHLCAGDYRDTLSTARRGAFVYLDPPYPALNGTSNFTHYTMDRFSVRNQEEVAEVAHDLDRRGSLFMMSNADTPLIRRLYSQFHLLELSTTRFVTCKSIKHRVAELLIKNYA